ncbi:DUF2191 domain-containing protein [Streptomyces sp. Amel2xC10]|uniref:DUF2191 domain-containing protein n=1 Tax=Streptomyces sp. Amel2xC10 TaxID=1305826 RepID=UPI000A089770|nr:DUF2191 domain-containing protein [Streptomyces sp. Amel2xC10]SMF06704.1 hypothetical protein SAMN02745830_01421 [Streptomyces sp. Amel2xC10]
MVRAGRTLIDIDEELNAALQEGVERKKRALALARLAARADAGDFDLLLDKENILRRPTVLSGRKSLAED